MVLFAGMGIPEKPAQQALTDFAGTPAGVLVLYIQDEVFDLERKLVGVAIWTSASVREPLHAAFLNTIEDLIAGLAGDPNSLQSSAIASPATEHSFQGIISTSASPTLPFYGEKVLPTCPVTMCTYVSGRSAI